jgi:hypothetical protein
MSFKIVVFWYVTPRTLVDRYHRHGGTLCFNNKATMETADSPETLASERRTSENGNLNTSSIAETVIF